MPCTNIPWADNTKYGLNNQVVFFICYITHHHCTNQIQVYNKYTMTTYSKHELETAAGYLSRSQLRW